MKRTNIFLTVLLLCIGMGARADNVVAIGSAEGAPGEEVTVSIGLTNTDALSSLQLSVPWDENLTLVEGSAQVGSRCAGHAANVGVKDGALQVVVYSLSMATIAPGSGDIVSFRLKLGSEPVSVTLQSTKTVLTDGSGNTTDGSCQSGTVTIRCAKAQFDTDEIDFGRVPIRSTYTREVAVTNVGNANLVVSSLEFSDVNVFSSTTQLPKTITPGSTANINVTFAPTERGAIERQLRIVSNSATRNRAIKLKALPYAVNELHIGDASGISDEEVTITMRMNNMDDISGYQVEFVLPSSLQYVDGSFAINDSRKQDHTGAASIVDGTLRLLAYSPSGKPLKGNDGEIGSFRIKLIGRNSVNLKPTKTVLSATINNKVENVVSDVYGGRVTIQYPAISTDGEINFGAVPVTEECKRTFSLNNYGSVPLIISRIVFTGEHLSVEEAMPLVIPKGQSSNVTVVYSSIEETAFEAKMQIYSNDPDRRLHEVNVRGSRFAPNYLNMQIPHVFEEETVKINLSVNTYDDVMGLQFDMEYPNSVYEHFDDNIQLSERAKGMTVSSLQMSPNTIRYVCYFLGGGSIAAGEGEVMSISLKPVAEVAPVGTYTVSIKNVKLGTAELADKYTGSDVSGSFQVLSNNKLFTLSCRRGGLVLNADATGLAAGQIRTDETEADKRFAIITYEGAQYLYSPVNKQYLLYDGSFVSHLGSSITFDDTHADGNYKFMISTQNEKGETLYFNNNGTYSVTGIIIARWDTPDDGNRWLIEPVADFDPTEALALASAQTYTVTYNVTFDDKVVATVTEEVAYGSALPPVPASLSNKFITLTETGTHPTTVTEDVTVTYNATWKGPFEFTKTAENAKWYNMHIRSGYYVGKQDTEPYYPAQVDEATLATPAYQWAFGGDPYHVKVYNRTTGLNETLTKDGDNAVMRSGDYTWDLLPNSNGFVLRVTGTENSCINQIGGNTGPLQIWTNSGSPTDDGSTFRVGDVIEETGPHGFSNKKLYTLTCKRGGMVLNANATGLAAGQIRTDETEADKRFAIITYEGAQYLYSPVNKQYLLYDGHFVSRLGSPITFDDTHADGEYKFMISTQNEKGETLYFNNDNGFTVSGFVIADFDTPDDGNRWLIEPVADFDPTEALALASAQTYTVTYNVTFDDKVVATATEEVAYGSALPPVPASLSNKFITLTETGTHPTTVSEDVTVTYKATWKGPFEFTNTEESAKWYNLKIRGVWYVSKQDTEPYKPEYSVDEEKRATPAYQWAFGGDPYHVKIYNRTTGLNETLTKDGENAVMRSGDYTWDLFPNNDGFVLRVTGTEYSCINQYGGGNGPLQFWTDSNSLTDDGSTFRVEEAIIVSYAQTLSLTELPAMTYGDESYMLPATTDQEQTLTWTSSNTDVAIIRDNVLTIKGAGTTTVTASHAGNILYQPFSKEYTLNVAKAPLTISVGNYTKKQYDPMPEFVVSYEGFKNNETKDVLTKQPTVSCEANEDSAPGVYDVVVSGAEAENYEIKYVAGKLTVTQPDSYTLTYIVDGEVYKTLTVVYGTALTPESEPIKEGYVFGGWSEIPETMPAHDVEVTGTFYLYGDVNIDTKVNVVDVVDIARYVVDDPSENFREKLADLNTDRTVNIADAVVLVNHIAGDQNFVKAEFPTNQFCDYESCNLELQAGEMNELSLCLTGDADFTAFQFEVDMPEGVDISATRINSQRKDGHQLLFNKVANNRYRVAALSLSNATFKGNDGELLNICLEGTGSDDICIHDIHFVTTNGTDIVFDNLRLNETATGIGYAYDNANRPIYDLQGRRQSKLQHGVNIVGNRKIFVK